MAFYNHLSSTMQEVSKRGGSVSQRRRARRVSDSVQSQERLDKSALSQLEAIDKEERPASVTDSQPTSPRYKARSVSRHKVGDSDTPRFKFSTDALDAADSEKPIAAGDTVYASSPKLETLQGEPLTVVSVNKSLDAAVVKDKNEKCMAVRLSYLKRE